MRSRMHALAEYVEERLSLVRQLFFELAGAVASAAGPGFGAVQVAATAAGVGILDSDQVKKLFPVGPFFLERHVAEADLDPADLALGAQAGLLHVAEILVAGHGT